MDSLGERLKALRLALDLNQIDVAEDVGIGRSSLSNIERDADAPGRETLAALATFYKVTVDWLLTGEGEMPRQLAPVELIRLGVGKDGGQPKFGRDPPKEEECQLLLQIWSQLPRRLRNVFLTFLELTVDEMRSEDK